MINLNLTNKKKQPTTKRRNDPKELFRTSLLEQIDGIVAEQNGQQATVKRIRFHKEVDRPLRKWWWMDGTSFFLTLRYSSQIIRIKDHQSINCGGSLQRVEKVLHQLLTALDKNDLDLIDAIEKAYQKTRWKKRPRSQR